MPTERSGRPENSEIRYLERLRNNNNSVETGKWEKKDGKETLSFYSETRHRSWRVHDIEPRDGPADTELSGPAIASSHGRVKARGAARGTGRTPTSHEFEQERGRQKDSGAERESESPRSREKKESLTAGPVHGERTIQKDKRRLCKSEDYGPSSVTWMCEEEDSIEASKKARLQFSKKGVAKKKKKNGSEKEKEKRRRG